MSRKPLKITTIYDTLKEVSDRIKQIYTEVKTIPEFFENPENLTHLDTQIARELARIPDNLLELIANQVPLEIRPSDDTEATILKRVEEELDSECILAQSLGWDGYGHRTYKALPKQSTVENILKKNAILMEANAEKIKRGQLIESKIIVKNNEEKLSVTIKPGDKWRKITRLPVQSLKDIEKKNDGLAITFLTIEGHGLQKPRELLNFPYLHDLTLRYSRTEELPDMSGFEYLTDVDLDGNNFDEFPLALLDLKAKTISLNENKNGSRYQEMDFIPDAVFQMETLEALYLENTKLKILPNSLLDSHLKKCNLFGDALVKHGSSRELEPFLKKTYPSSYVHPDRALSQDYLDNVLEEASLLYLMSSPAENKEYEVSDAHHLFLYTNDKNQFFYRIDSCNVFFMSRPSSQNTDGFVGKLYVSSDKNNLYLYKDKKDNTKVYYLIDNNKVYLDDPNVLNKLQAINFDSPVKCVDKELREAIIENAAQQGHVYAENKYVVSPALLEGKFDQTPLNPKNCPNEELSIAVLNITAERGHTKKHPTSYDENYRRKSSGHWNYDRIKKDYAEYKIKTQKRLEQPPAPIIYFSHLGDQAKMTLEQKKLLKQSEAPKPCVSAAPAFVAPPPVPSAPPLAPPSYEDAMAEGAPPKVVADPASPREVSQFFLPAQDNKRKREPSPSAEIRSAANTTQPTVVVDDDSVNKRAPLKLSPGCRTQ